MNKIFSRYKVFFIVLVAAILLVIILLLLHNYYKKILVVECVNPARVDSLTLAEREFVDVEAKVLDSLLLGIPEISLKGARPCKDKGELVYYIQFEPNQKESLCDILFSGEKGHFTEQENGAVVCTGNNIQFPTRLVEVEESVDTVVACPAIVLNNLVVRKEGRTPHN